MTAPVQVAEHRSRIAWPDALFDALKRAGVRQVGYVPDAGHTRLIERCIADNDIRDVVLTTEEEGVALAAGAWLGGQRCALLMQSSGVGNGINMLSLVAHLPLPHADVHHHARRVGGVQSVAGADGLDRRAGAESMRGGSLPRAQGRTRCKGIAERACSRPTATSASSPCCCRRN